MENHQLYKLKKDLISEQATNNQAKDFPNFSCNYHGIALTFYSQNENFLYDLKTLLPESWHNTTKGSHIYFINPDILGISLDRWCDEESQDCFFEAENEIVIQRDFAAKCLGDNNYIVISENKVCDGFYNFLRWYLPKRLLIKNTLVLHSACILDKNGNAHFFLGHSGAGKSTSTGLSRPRKILGDDMNLLQIEGSELFAIPGAIGGLFKPDVNYDERFPVGSFNWLIQDSEDRRTEMTAAESISKFIASVTNVFWDTLDKEQIDFIFKVASDIFKTKPMYQINFTKSSKFWDFIEN